MLASRALDQAGHRDSAVAVARDAEQTFARCGARRERDGAAFELRRLGARAPARAQKRKAGGLTSLSPREFEVAELVAAGHGNRQIAALCL
jgi:DNA-binding NarL/FixJ family response regulator